MSYNTLAMKDLAELKTRRGSSNNLIGLVLGLNFPFEEGFIVYEWRNESLVQGDDYEVVAPTTGAGLPGRWHRVENAVQPQVNADWFASDGPAKILNKPTIPAAQVASDWTATSGPTQVLNKPSIPAAQVPSDWSAVSGPSQVLNKPAFSAVSFTGAYADLSGKPNLSAVATSGSYTDLSGKPTIPAAQVNSDWSATAGVAQILNKPTFASVAMSGSYSDLSGKPNYATVAATGDYNDLLNKPSLSSIVQFGAPVTKTVNKAVAYQATNPAKPASILITLTSTSSFSLAGTVANTANIVIGTNATNVAAGTGTVIAKYNNTLGGGLTVGLNVTNTATNTYTINLPAGWYFAVVQTVGTGITVDSVFEQVVG